MPFTFEQRIFIVENYLKYESFKNFNRKAVPVKSVVQKFIQIFKEIGPIPNSKRKNVKTIII